MAQGVTQTCSMCLLSVLWRGLPCTKSWSRCSSRLRQQFSPKNILAIGALVTLVRSREEVTKAFFGGTVFSPVGSTRSRSVTASWCPACAVSGPFSTRWVSQWANENFPHELWPWKGCSGGVELRFSMQGQNFLLAPIDGSSLETSNGAVPVCSKRGFGIHMLSFTVPPQG